MTEEQDNSDKNTIPDWKNALSGALNDTQLTFALVVLFIFFVVYVFFDGVFIDSNRKDIDEVKDLPTDNSDCNCKSFHKIFYIVWFTICSALWVLGPFVLWIFQCCSRCCIKIESDSCTSSLAKIHDCITEIAKNIRLCNSKNVKKIADPFLKLFKVDRITGPLKKIEDLKWFEYYNMHITGTYITKIKFKKIKKRILKAIGPSDANKSEQEAKKDSNGKSKQTIDEKVDIEEIEGNYCCSYCAIVFYSVCFLLECMRIIAQRAAVPLLMVQAFDTYAFICFTGNEYCSATAQYDIPLGQAAITFAFSVSIMVSALTVAMLKWFKYKRSKFLCGCETKKLNCNQYKWIQSCI